MADHTIHLPTFANGLVDRREKAVSYWVYAYLLLESPGFIPLNKPVVIFKYVRRARL